MNDTPRLGRPRDQSVDIAILKAAVDRLSRFGYERMTIDDVARDAGVSRPTVYLRWASKEALGISAVESLIKETAHEPTGDFRADLLDQAESMQRRWSAGRYLGILGTAIVERESHRAIYDLFLEKIIIPRREALKETLKAGIRQNVVRPDIDIEVVVTMFVGSFYAVTVAEQWDQLQNWAERLTESLMRSIALPDE